MPRITFTETRILQDEHRGTERETRYEAGQTYEMPPASCERWKLRGVAVDAAPEAMTAFESEVVAAVSDNLILNSEGAGEPLGILTAEPELYIPDGWEKLPAAERIALANRLSAVPVEKAKAADAVIAAEVARRAAETPAD